MLSMDDVRSSRVDMKLTLFAMLSLLVLLASEPASLWCSKMCVDLTGYYSKHFVTD